MTLFCLQTEQHSISWQQMFLFVLLKLEIRNKVVLISVTLVSWAASKQLNGKHIFRKDFSFTIVLKNATLQNEKSL